MELLTDFWNYIVGVLKKKMTKDIPFCISYPLIVSIGLFFVIPLKL